MHKFFTDAQAAMSFLVPQATHIETQIDKIEYPDIQYPDLIPVDYSAPEWVKSVTYFSQDKVGQADWYSALGRDVPRASTDRTKFEAPVYMAALGYGYTTEELAQAQMLGQSLTADDAEAARRGYEEFVDNVALNGDSSKGLSGLINYPGVTAVNATADGVGASSLWSAKSPDLIARDINQLITGVWTTTKQISYADTVLLPPSLLAYISTTRFDPNAAMTILEWIEKRNIYTVTTGQNLVIRGVRGLETAGAGSSGRMVAYRRSPRVLKMHIPMRHKFLPPMQTGPLMYEVPGIFRLGGVDVRRPAEVRYMDQIS